MSCDWLNLGLQDPRITGSNDPITGTNDPATSWFDLPLKSGSTIRLRGLPEFVRREAEPILSCRASRRSAIWDR